jgi:hypothetical protein
MQVVEAVEAVQADQRVVALLDLVAAVQGALAKHQEITASQEVLVQLTVAAAAVGAVVMAVAEALVVLV